MKRNSNGTYRTNAQLALESYIQWIRWYPSDYEGATEAASDFIDNEDDMNEFESSARQMANQ